jgi:hypothetical protein
MSQVAEPQRTQECEIRMGTIEARTGLKDLGTTGARWLILVPGAGIEPARTLPGPRDFKLLPLFSYQSLSNSNTQNQKLSLPSVCLCPVVPGNGSGTEWAHFTGTV